MHFINTLAILVSAVGTAAQFTNPTSASRLDIGQTIQIQWNTNGLQAPLSISLVPAGTVVRQDIVLQQIAVNIGNVGILTWSADQTITAFPQFAMVIVDARSRVVVSDAFVINSLTRQPALITENGKAQPTVTGPIKVHVSGTNTLDKMIEAPKETRKVGNGNGKKKQTGGRKNGQQQKGKQDKAENLKCGNDNNGAKGQQNKNKNGQEKAKGKNKDQNNDKEDVNQKEDQNQLLPLPGLPENGEDAPVSLQPLPNVSATSTQDEESAPTTAALESSSTTSIADASATPSEEVGDSEAIEEAKPAHSTTLPTEDAAQAYVARPVEEKTDSVPSHNVATTSAEEITPVGGIILPPTSAPEPTELSSSSLEALPGSAIDEELPQTLQPLPIARANFAEPALPPASVSLPGGSFREEPAAMLETPGSLKRLPGVATEFSSLRTLPTISTSITPVLPTSEAPLVANKASQSNDAPATAASGQLLPSLVLVLCGFLASFTLV